MFLPALDRILNRDRDPLLRWLDLPREGGGSDLLMAPGPDHWRYQGPRAQQLPQGSRQRAQGERADATALRRDDSRQAILASRAARRKRRTTAPSYRAAARCSSRCGPCSGPTSRRSIRRRRPRRRCAFASCGGLSAGWQPPVIEEGADRLRLPLDDSALAPQIARVQLGAGNLASHRHGGAPGARTLRPRG